ncbi:hypothetical protein TELCIR_13387 [Teladorsagia circumcincta]|uniref:Uncharacterized protein n=1 Tax=Teladorsagia circumcincta TaxID=45464 RepID=A0A2G9U455_TELCI|nr:hypothetical protein TELCIR_13387 [Teladorsagia circumcincta]
MDRTTRLLYYSDASLMKKLGLFAAKELAAILDSEKVSDQCEKIVLSNVVEAQQYAVPHQNASQFDFALYDVTFFVSPPALGRFKILIRDGSHGKLELAGELFDRLDWYGNHGDCMKKDTLRPLCTCKNAKASKG